MIFSLIMPVYNEQRLLPHHLAMAAPHVDRIVLVDGGPEGPSTDGTRDLIEELEYDNVEVLEGKFALLNRKGGWDKKSQIMCGVDAVRNTDVLIIASCDCMYDDYEVLREQIKKHPDGKVYYAYSREFFIDTQHIRLINQGGYPLPQVGHIIMRKEVFSVETPSLFNPSLVDDSEYVFLPDVAKFHYGWVTPFDTQVRKHIRNVLSGAWGELGEEILGGGEMNLETWAITHVLNYSKEIVFQYAGKSHPLNGSEITFSYLENFDSVVEDFQQKYKKSYYDCI